MLIDEYLPVWDVNEIHCTEINAARDVIFRQARRLDLRSAVCARLLFRLRGLSAPVEASLDALLRMGFVLLGEKPDEEITLGLVGQFWTPSGKLRRIPAENFRAFNEAGYAKAVWNFSLSDGAGGAALLKTETRVLCLDESSRWRFRLYWSAVGFFSGIIRREILQVIKNSAEREQRAAAVSVREA